jgi:hypothetical protein
MPPKRKCSVTPQKVKISSLLGQLSKKSCIALLRLIQKETDKKAWINEEPSV